jgi:predicted kinase
MEVIAADPLRPRGLCAADPKGLVRPSSIADPAIGLLVCATLAGLEGRTMLVVFGGLPGTGKTTIARQVAGRLGATYLRIDTIEQVLRSQLGLPEDVGPAGYDVAYAVGQANLELGRTVVADCVNPLEITRAAWRRVAARAASPIVEVELICSDAAEHRRRVESRESDIPGLAAPSWASVAARHYEPWSAPRMVIDTACASTAEAVSAIVDAAGRR